MKGLFVLLLVSFAGQLLMGQSLVGAWETTMKKESQDVRIVVIFSEKHQVATWYNAESGSFISTNGGGWSLEGNTVTEVVEFDSSRPQRAGSEVSFEIEISDSEMAISGEENKFVRIDDGTPGDLAGAWIIKSRIVNDLPQSIDTNSPRKTMKILSGTRFQWIAYNTDTGGFFGTGGGTYSTDNGKYTENIEFFSRDDDRVGASLRFNYDLMNGDWRHIGNSSKGNPINETWGRR